MEPPLGTLVRFLPASGRYLPPGSSSEPALSASRALTANKALVFCPIYKKAEFLKVYGPIRLASSFHAWVSKRSFEGGCLTWNAKGTKGGLLTGVSFAS